MLGRTPLLALTLLIATGILCCGPTQAFASKEAAPADSGPAASAPVEEKTETSTGSNMEGIDWAVIGGYFAMLGLLAWWVIRKNKDTADDYFLAGRNLGWFIVGASIFASNIGSEHLVGLAGSGCTDGVAMAHYELHAWCLLVLAWVLVPFYSRSKVFTMPEFLERRFNPTSRWVLSLISLMAYVVTKIAVGIFAGGIVFSVLLADVGGMGPEKAFWVGSILVILLTGAYTVLGGLRAVAYTEAVQTVVLVIGSILVTVYGLQALGGWDALREVAGSDMFNLWKPLVPEGVQASWAPVDTVVTNPDTGVKSGELSWYFNDNYPWLSMLFCAPVIGLWYWCTDQYIVQRALGAPNEREARRGAIFASMLKLLPVFIFIIPGMICFALMFQWQTGNSERSFEAMLKNETFLKSPDTLAKYPGFITTAEDGNDIVDITKMRADEPEQAALLLADVRTARQEVLLTKHAEFVTTVDGKRQLDMSRMIEEAPEQYALLQAAAKSNIRDSGMSFPMMVTTVLPRGVRGLVVAGLLAALMSSLAGVFNASATLFTMDFYSKLRPNTSQHRLVWIGRFATVVMVLIGLAWIPVIQGSKGLYDYLQGVQAYLAPPIFVVFFMGIFWKRLNGAGCLAALIVGAIMGIFRLAIDTPVKLKMTGFEDGYPVDSFLWVVNKMFFQYYSILILIVCAVAMVTVSFVTRKPDYGKITGLTYGTMTDKDRAESRASWNWADVTASAIVLGAILAAYLYFQG